MSLDVENLIRINKDHAKPAVEVLAKAFSDYPLLQYYFPDKTNRDKILHHFLSFPVYIGIKYGEVYATSPNLEGIAVWIPSHNFPLSTWRLLRSVPLMTIFNFGRYGASKLKPFSDYIDEVHLRVASAKHWFLQAIGVDPKFQRKGYASKLLSPILSKLDKECLPCYLETLDEKNVSIYEHFGFKTIDKSSIPKTEFTNWAMLRKPRNRNHV